MSEIPPTPPVSTAQVPPAVVYVPVPANVSGSLASPWIRLVAFIIDSLLFGVLFFVLSQLIYPKVDPAEIEAAVKELNLARIAELSDPGMFRKIMVIVFANLVFIGINFKFLQNGQTLGKKILNIRIVSRSTSQPLPFPELLAKRILPFYILLRWSWYGPLIVLVSILCIFRSGKNTLHDDLAGSKVVRV